jgi:hypothetical protein
MHFFSKKAIWNGTKSFELLNWYNAFRQGNIVVWDNGYKLLFRTYSDFGTTYCLLVGTAAHALMGSPTGYLSRLFFLMTQMRNAFLQRS